MSRSDWAYIETDAENRNNIEDEIVALGGHVVTYKYKDGYVFEADKEYLSRFADEVYKGPSPSQGGGQWRGNWTVY